MSIPPSKQGTLRSLLHGPDRIFSARAWAYLGPPTKGSPRNGRIFPAIHALAGKYVATDCAAKLFTSSFLATQPLNITNVSIDEVQAPRRIARC